MSEKVNCHEFLSMLHDQTEDVGETDNNNICLISQETLKPDHITMLCGHMFNYEHILKEVIQQKTKYNPLDTGRLRVNQIKCPYCRMIQNKILPMRTEKIYGVNTPDKHCMRPYKCSYTFKSGKRAGCLCDKESYTELCKTHTSKQSKSLETCSSILKFGKNKGNQCTCVVYVNGKCKRHSSLPEP